MNETLCGLVVLVPLWTAIVGDSPEAGYSSPVVSENRIYITGNFDEKHTILCLDTDGKEIWRYSSGAAWTEMFPGTRGTPIFDRENETEYLSITNPQDREFYSQYQRPSGAGEYTRSGSSSCVPMLWDESPLGEIVCLETETGKLRWRRNVLDDYETKTLLYGRSGSLLIDDEHLFTQLGGEKGSMLCMEKKTGKTVWLAPSTGHAAGYGTPAMFSFENETLIAAMDAKGLFAVNRRTGKLLFHVRHPARLDENISTPIYHEGRIFITNGAGSDSKLLQLVAEGDEVRAEEVWTNRLMANSHGGVVLLDGKLYGATNKRGGGFACIRFEDGADVFLDRQIVRGSFDVRDGIFYILTEFGEVVVARPKENGFEVLARLELPGGEGGQAYSHPVVRGNRFYARIGNVLHCIELKNELEDGWKTMPIDERTHSGTMRVDIFQDFVNFLFGPIKLSLKSFIHIEKQSAKVWEGEKVGKWNS